jgi:hypothetical protein
MIDLSPAQAADRIAKLLAAPESRTLDFKRIGGQQPIDSTTTPAGGKPHGHRNTDR